MQRVQFLRIRVSGNWYSPFLFSVSINFEPICARNNNSSSSLLTTWVQTRKHIMIQSHDKNGNTKWRINDNIYVNVRIDWEKYNAHKIQSAIVDMNYYQLIRKTITYLSRLPWKHLGTPLKVNGVPGNIQDNLTTQRSWFRRRKPKGRLDDHRATTGPTRSCHHNVTSYTLLAVINEAYMHGRVSIRQFYLEEQFNIA